MPILHHQAVGHLLAEVAMKIAACRAFSWKAAHYLDQYDSEGHAVGAMAKVFCGETLFNAIFRAMQAMDVNSLDKKHPVEKYLREAAVLPLYGAGNIGMQMRKIWGVMLDPEFDPRAIADSRPIQFKKIHGRRWNTRFARRANARGCDSLKTTPKKSGALIGTQVPSLPT